MRTSYSFSVLRYVHDPVTQEFINIGVALYSPDSRFLRAICTTHYARITRLFDRIDGNRFRQITRYVQDQINAIGESLPSQLPFEPAQAIEHLLARVLPADDSSVQFSPAGVGFSANLGKTLEEVYERYVERYSMKADSSRRDDDEVWRVFRTSLDKRDITARLTPKRIVAPSYDYEFQRAWKNKIWHVYEPVSFDLVDGGSMLEKANRWVGRATSLNDSSESFEIHMLLGRPEDDRLQNTFVKAQNILNKMPGLKEFIQEGEAEEFAAQLEKEITQHSEH